MPSAAEPSFPIGWRVNLPTDALEPLFTLPSQPGRPAPRRVETGHPSVSGVAIDTRRFSSRGCDSVAADGAWLYCPPDSSEGDPRITGLCGVGRLAGLAGTRRKARRCRGGVSQGAME